MSSKSPPRPASHPSEVVEALGGGYGVYGIVNGWRRQFVACNERQKWLRVGGIKMKTSPNDQTQWTVEWLDAVANGSSTMSQRKLSSVEQRGGGIEAVEAIAKRKGVHLLLIEDDKGNELVAASTKPFKVVC